MMKIGENKSNNIDDIFNDMTSDLYYAKEIGSTNKYENDLDIILYNVVSDSVESFDLTNIINEETEPFF